MSAKTKKVTSVTAKNEATASKFTGSKERSKKVLTVVNTRDTFWSPAKKGDFVEGEFIKFEKSFGGKFGALEMNPDTKKKEKVSYRGVIAEHSTGEIIKMPSAKVLNDFFEEMKEGTYVRVTFEGSKLKKGMKASDKNSTYNDFTLESDAVEPKSTKKK